LFCSIQAVRKLEEVMENAPVISLNFHSPAPGADPEVFQRYLKWREQVYSSLLIKIPQVKELVNNEIIRDSLEYPHFGTILHFENLQSLESYNNSEESKAVVGELSAWAKRGIRESIWSVTYELIKSIRSGAAYTPSRPDTRIENAQVVSLEAFRLSAEEEEKYFNWFNDFGFDSFVPLFTRFPGLKGYDWYRFLRLGLVDAKEDEYPKYLSLIYFENIPAFDNFVKSPELAAFLKMLGSVFPRGLNYKWYVQYQLTKSWRK
jgi:hypothetical protein